jgi:hypothetical protein
VRDVRTREREREKDGVLDWARRDDTWVKFEGAGIYDSPLGVDEKKCGPLRTLGMASRKSVLKQVSKARKSRSVANKDRLKTGEDSDTLLE